MADSSGSSSSRRRRGTAGPSDLILYHWMGRSPCQKLLSDHDLRAVDVITFPEGKLRDASVRLRKGLGLGAAGLALVTADDLAEHTDE